jgi:hypothetical protein
MKHRILTGCKKAKTICTTRVKYVNIGFILYRSGG